MVEGDSLVILCMFTKLLHGLMLAKISTSQRILHHLKNLLSLIQPNNAWVPSHVCREGNKIVDHLANMGIKTLDQYLCDYDVQNLELPLFHHFQGMADLEGTP